MFTSIQTPSSRPQHHRRWSVSHRTTANKPHANSVRGKNNTRPVKDAGPQSTSLSCCPNTAGQTTMNCNFHEHSQLLANTTQLDIFEQMGEKATHF